MVNELFISIMRLILVLLFSLGGIAMLSFIKSKIAYLGLLPIVIALLMATMWGVPNPVKLLGSVLILGGALMLNLSSSEKRAWRSLGFIMLSLGLILVLWNGIWHGGLCQIQYGNVSINGTA